MSNFKTHGHTDSYASKKRDRRETISWSIAGASTSPLPRGLRTSKCGIARDALRTVHFVWRSVKLRHEAKRLPRHFRTIASPQPNDCRLILAAADQPALSERRLPTSYTTRLTSVR
ncbi:hypothetical protein EVAR_67723_1 [Eumeta japonica]|uniref:Uncharacterized protein n=1 Tax=Eumeta variegata TaxID=151549 RepID=A0A4C1Z9Z0_EUMVA|nr:hypothetical protein EVAR_67723_1 [Eumeta japonica]